MISALPKLVAARRPRPDRLSNQGCCYSDDQLAAILAKPDEELAGGDYQSLLTISRCTGTYEELVYFVPLCIRYCAREPQAGGDCLSQLVHFLSCELDRFKDDGLAGPVVEALRELFAGWTATFGVTHYDHDACRANGWRLNHSDLVDRSKVVQGFIDDLVRYDTFAGLAEELVGSLAAPPPGDPRSAWFLEYAYECRAEYASWLQTRDEIRAQMRSLLERTALRDGFDDTPPWSRSARIVSLINDTELLRRHFASIEPSLIAAERSPTYWPAVRELLDFPEAAQPAEPVVAPAFSVNDAKPFRPEPSQAPPSKPRAGPLWPEMKARRERMVESMKALAASAGLPVDETLASTMAPFAGMGTRFRGRVPGFEQEMAFRLLLVSGNYALCENEAGRLRIPVKDFAAACESGKLVEPPEDDGGPPAPPTTTGDARANPP